MFSGGRGCGEAGFFGENPVFSGLFFCGGDRVIVDEMFEDGSLHNPSGAYQSIFGLDVAPQWQHRGIAGELMRYMIEDARRRGRRGLILTCKDRLIGFYEGLGYKSLGVSQSVHGGAVWYDMILEFSE